MRNVRALFRKFVILEFVCLAIASPVVAQQAILWQGVVKPEQINVYVGASTREGVGSTLTKGDLVSVTLEINDDLGGAWCRIALPGQAEQLGFVPCMNLERVTNASKRAVQEAVSPHATANPSSEGTPETTPGGSGVLTNRDILDLNKTGLSPDVLVAKIKSSRCTFNTAPQQLQQLKANGVPDAVILAMVQAPSDPGPGMDHPAVAEPATGTADSSEAMSGAPSPSGKLSRADLAIEPGSRVFIEPMNGFESYLSAAIEKKHVPLVVVASEDKADFVITGASDTKKAGWAKIIFMANLHSDEEASITMVNRTTGAVVFAYAVNKKNTLHGQQTSAEACAKHLKNRIEGKE